MHLQASGRKLSFSTHGSRGRSRQGSKEIDRFLKKDANDDKYLYRILLFGGPKAGKSTFIQAIKQGHKNLNGEEENLTSSSSSSSSSSSFFVSAEEVRLSLLTSTEQVIGNVDPSRLSTRAENAMNIVLAESETIASNTSHQSVRILDSCLAEALLAEEAKLSEEHKKAEQEKIRQLKRINHRAFDLLQSHSLNKNVTSMEGRITYNPRSSQVTTTAIASSPTEIRKTSSISSILRKTSSFFSMRRMSSSSVEEDVSLSPLRQKKNSNEPPMKASVSIDQQDRENQSKIPASPNLYLPQSRVIEEAVVKPTKVNNGVSKTSQEHADEEEDYSNLPLAEHVDLSAEIVESIKILSEDAEFQRASQETGYDQAMTYFSQNINRISSPGYSPDAQDALVATSFKVKPAIIEERLIIGGTLLSLSIATSLAYETKSKTMWDRFDNSNAAIYLAAMDIYDSVDLLKVTLRRFKLLCQICIPRMIPISVIFTKGDILKEKLKVVPYSLKGVRHEDYQGRKPENALSEQEFLLAVEDVQAAIKSLYRRAYRKVATKLNIEKRKQPVLTSYFISSTDDAVQVKAIYNAIHDLTISAILKDTGMMG